MVRIILGLLFVSTLALSDVFSVARSFVEPETYKTQRNLINVLFKNESKYLKPSGEVNTLAVVRTLKANGLLNLSYNSAKQLKVSFDVTHKPLLAMKVINDALKSLGYTYYLTNNISKHGDNLYWEIAINTQNLIDPVALAKKLREQGCITKRVQRSGKSYWSYKINAKNAKVKTIPLIAGRLTDLKKPNRPYWLKVRGVNSIQIEANKHDNWFPLIVFYDEGLYPIEEINLDKKQKQAMNVKIPENAAYMKVTDKFILDNIKRGLTVTLN